MKLIRPQAITTEGDFSRNSIASLYDSLGLLKYAAVNSPRFTYDPSDLTELPTYLSEGQTTNLFNYSERFERNDWAKPGSAVWSAQTKSPDGKINACKLVEGSTSVVGHYIEQQPNVEVGQIYTMSWFVKAAERRQVDLVVYDRLNTSNNVAYRVNIVDGIGLASTNSGTAQIIDKNIESLPNGWYRVWMTFSLGSSTTQTFSRIVICNDSGGEVYAGIVGYGVYIWGAQFEKGSKPTSYIPSAPVFISRTGAANYFDSAGILRSAAANVARYSYDPANLTGEPILLLEGAMTNQLVSVNEFSGSGWNKNTITIASNSSASPDGTTNADRLTATGDDSYVGQSFNVTAGNTYTFSVFLKSQYFDNVNLFFGNPSEGYASVICECTDQWIRFSVSKICTLTGAWGVQIGGAGTMGAGDIIFAWGAQCEIGTTATSFSAVSRTADIYNLPAATREADVSTSSVISSVLLDEIPYNATEVTAQGDQRLYQKIVYEQETGSAGTVTWTNSSKFTWSGDWPGMLAGWYITFSSTGTLPTNISPNTNYLISTPDATAKTFGVTTLAGTAISTSAGTGTLTAKVTSASNFAAVPGTNPSVWVPVGVVNRERMFDKSISSQTTAQDFISVEVTLKDLADSVTVLNCEGRELRVAMLDPIEGVVFDKTVSLIDNSNITDIFDYLYEPPSRKQRIVVEGLPQYANAKLRVTISGQGEQVACGVLYVGRSKFIGYTQYGIEFGMQDFSVKEPDEFGDYTVAERAYSDRMPTDVWVELTSIDTIIKMLKSYRATPIVYIGTDNVESAICYGFFKDFTIVWSEVTIVLLSMEIESLT